MIICMKCQRDRNKNWKQGGCVCVAAEGFFGGVSPGGYTPLMRPVREGDVVAPVVDFLPMLIKSVKGPKK